MHARHCFLCLRPCCSCCGQRMSLLSEFVDGDKGKHISRALQTGEYSLDISTAIIDLPTPQKQDVLSQARSKLAQSTFLRRSRASSTCPSEPQSSRHRTTRSSHIRTTPEHTEQTSTKSDPNPFITSCHSTEDEARWAHTHHTNHSQEDRKKGEAYAHTEQA